MCIRDRVKKVLKGNESTELYHVTWLPTDWTAGERYPVIIELAGNGPYRNGFGDISTGRPEGSKLGYGISGGRNYIWICLPFIDDTGKKIATSWWGKRPGPDPQPTRKYIQRAVPEVCRRHGTRQFWPPSIGRASGRAGGKIPQPQKDWIPTIR